MSVRLSSSRSSRINRCHQSWSRIVMVVMMPALLWSAKASHGQKCLPHELAPATPPSSACRVESRTCGSLALLPIDKIQAGFNDISSTCSSFSCQWPERQLLSSTWRLHLMPGLPRKPSISETSTSDDLPVSLNPRSHISTRGALLRIPISRFITPNWWQPDLYPIQLEMWGASACHI